MSNPAKALKKALKVIVVVAVIAAVAYFAWPALTAGSSTAAAGTAAGGAAAGTAASTAGAAAGGAAAGAGAAASTAAATGATAAATVPAAAAATGGILSNPMVQYGLVSAGTSALTNALAEEPQTAAEQLTDQLNVYHSIPRESRTFGFSGTGGLLSNQSAVAPSQVTAVAPEFVQSPIAPTTPSAGSIGRYNPDTRRWERTG